jgi:hypothetical protein
MGGYHRPVNRMQRVLLPQHHHHPKHLKVSEVTEHEAR